MKSTILDLIASTEADMGKFLQWQKVEDVDQIPAARFDEIMKALRAKQKK